MIFAARNIFDPSLFNMLEECFFISSLSITFSEIHFTEHFLYYFAVLFYYALNFYLALNWSYANIKHICTVYVRTQTHTHTPPPPNCGLNHFLECIIAKIIA